MNNAYGLGYIKDIIHALLDKSGMKDIHDIHTEDKLEALCETLQLDPSEFDELIANNSPVMRTIKGHAFEEVFDYLIKSNGFEVTVVGGDEEIDRIVNGVSLQLKTPTEAGTTQSSVQYKTHKTHGAKSELEDMSYYHKRKDFADYLVGLISYNPLNIVFISKAELPGHPRDNKHIISPFNLIWEKHPGLNAYNKI